MEHGLLVHNGSFVGFFERSADAVPSMPSFAVVAADADKRQLAGNWSCAVLPLDCLLQIVHSLALSFAAAAAKSKSVARRCWGQPVDQNIYRRH